MNIVWRLLAGLALLLSLGVLTAWAWDKSDSLSHAAAPAATDGAAAGAPAANTVVSR